MQNDEQRLQLMRFFKTGKGDYGEGDEFLGLKVPQTRAVVTQAIDLPMEQVPELLTHRYHEIRLCGLLILVSKFQRFSTRRLINDKSSILQRDAILMMYLDYAHCANNWDLVDLSAPKIVGQWLMLPSDLGDKIAIMDSLAHSGNLWKERIGMVSTWTTSRQGDPSWCIRYAKIHLNHTHDLMHKAVGWMLREMGKQCGMDLLRDFLEQYAHKMPRTMLRYAIEKMDAIERKHWMTV